MTMHKRKRKALEAAGWKVGSAQDFLGLSDAESALIEVKLALGRAVKARRAQRRMSQADVAARVRSSQSRVAKMESGDASVSIDLLVRTLLALGASRQELARSLSA
jgi:ribosome-binding protein aMBF1 (putative translation factor)